jgi:transglutaminase-like putative cysteine protease
MVMSLEHWFRLSQYLTLGLSCAALVFAETPFLPELQICLAPVLALLFLAWWVDGRWGLPNWGANLLGLLIAAAGLFWLVTQLSDNDFVLAHLPLHLALLPYMGPLSMAALLVKVFRRRDAGHFWHLQGLGLLQIALGCLLDGGPVFGALMAAYLASDLICLTLHYRLAARKGANSYPRHDQQRAEEMAATLLSNGRGPGNISLLAFALRWTVLISAASLLLFLLTPRHDNWSWEPLSRLRSGYSRNHFQGVGEEMNLNHIGRVEMDDAVALHVAAVDAVGQPKLDLPADQRWRGSVLDWYDHGKWLTMHLMPMRPWRSRQEKLPDFGPDQFFLTFTVQPRQSGGLVLAEPIRFGPDQARLPVLSLDNYDRRRLFVEFSGTVLPQMLTNLRREYRYRQVMPPAGDLSRIPAEGVWPPKEIQLLTNLPSSLYAPLQDWTVQLLRRLAQHPLYRLPEGVRAALANPADSVSFAQDHWEAVARALTDYLAYSGEYTYTLEITRHNRSIDPVLDFLINVKQGHCERYAAALALMLRSVGIPARVIKGFRGCDSLGDGHYVVRHSHAHAWVETLVPHVPSVGEAQAPLRRTPLYDWLTLDPTPPEPMASARRLSMTRLWEEVQRFCLQWWRALIVEYNGDQQADLWDTLMSAPTLSLLQAGGLVVSAFAAAAALGLFLRRLRYRRSAPFLRRDGAKGPSSDLAIYPRLVRILTRYTSLRPVCGQTPREYGAAAWRLLQARPAWAALAGLPMHVVELFYRVRFAGRPLNERERREIDKALARFAEKLRS